LRFLATFPRAAAATAPAATETPCRPPLRPNDGYPPLLGEHLVEPGSLPGRERRRLAGDGRCRATLAGQGTDCFDFNLFRVFCVKVRTWLRSNLSKFSCKSVQSLRKFLENCRKFRKMPNQFC
jgi:hypothetical protein